MMTMLYVNGKEKNISIDQVTKGFHRFIFTGSFI